MIKEDMKNLTLEEALVKNNLSLKEAFEKCLPAPNKGSIKNEEYNDDRYIQSKRNYYYVRKCIKGKLIHFGKYKTKSDAIKVRDYFIREGWNPLSVAKVCRELGVERLPQKKRKRRK